MPQGKLWESKTVPDTNLRALMYGCAKPMNISQLQIQELAKELNVNTTVQLIDDWETSVGLPDECSGLAITIDERRAAVVDRLRRSPIVKIAELQARVDELAPGLGLTLSAGFDYFSLPASLPMQLLGDLESRFLLVLEVPAAASSLAYQLPQQLIRGLDIDAVLCGMNKIIPGNVYIEVVEI